MFSSDYAARFAAGLMYAAAAAVGALPLRLQWWLADRFAALVNALRLREARIARRNLELIALPQSAEDRTRAIAAILRGTARTAVESFRIWTRPRPDNLALVGEVFGLDVLQAAEAAGRGVILIAPHYGNIEMVVEYLAARGPFALVYRAPVKRAGDLFLRRARGGANITLVPAEATAMRPLWKALKDGGVVGITPDQQPKLGSGEFAPFFAKSALTLSLIPRLAERSGAALVLAYAERRGDYGFDLHFEAGDPRIADADLSLALTVMNAQVEAIARRDLGQYQWTYKRFSKRPPNSGERNPYYPDCY